MDLHSTVFKLQKESDRLTKVIEEQQISNNDVSGIDQDLLERKFLMDRAIRGIKLKDKQIKTLFILVIITCIGFALAIGFVSAIFFQ